MKKLQSFLLMISVPLFISGQVKQTQGGLFSQSYSKEFTEYAVKEYLVTELLQIPDRQTTEVEINAITAAKSGELTVVIYNCKPLNKRGLILVFWNDYINEFNSKYNGYAFKNLEFAKAQEVLDELEKVLDEKKDIIKIYEGDVFTINAVYRYEDLTFLFYKGVVGENLIRVFWSGFDSDWNQSNLKTMHRRFNSFFKDK